MPTLVAALASRRGGNRRTSRLDKGVTGRNKRKPDQRSRISCRRAPREVRGRTGRPQLAGAAADGCKLPFKIPDSCAQSNVLDPQLHVPRAHRGEAMTEVVKGSAELWKRTAKLLKLTAQLKLVVVEIQR
jgi:hypothetical protein